MTFPLSPLLWGLAVDRANVLVRRFTELRQRTYPLRIAHDFAQVGLMASQRVRDEAMNDKASSAVGKLQSHHTFLEFLETVLVPLCEASDIDYTLAGLSTSLHRLVTRMMPSTQLLLHSINQFNYGWEAGLGEYIHRTFAAAGYEDILTDAGVTGDLWFLYAAALPPNGILTHTVLGHELGHGLYRAQRLGDTLFARTRPRLNEGKTRALIDESVRSQTIILPSQEPLQLPLLDPSSVELIVRSNLYRITTNWLEELACDLIGLHLLGPAFVLAQLHFLPVKNDLDQFSTTHPSGRMRLTLLMNTLLGTKRGLGFRLVVEPNVRSTFTPWLQVVTKQNPRPRDPFYEIPFDAVISSQGDILASVKAIFRSGPCKGLLYSRETFESAVPNLMNAFADGLPGNAYWQNTEKGIVYEEDIVSCLNAAWLLYFTRGDEVLSQLLPHMTNEERKARFYQVVQKSVEYIELRHHWNSIEP